MLDIYISSKTQTDCKQIVCSVLNETHKRFSK